MNMDGKRLNLNVLANIFGEIGPGRHICKSVRYRRSLKGAKLKFTHSLMPNEHYQKVCEISQYKAGYLTINSQYYEVVTSHRN